MPDLPQGTAEAGGQRSFTIDEALALQRRFAREMAQVVAVANFKGGVGKTSLAAHLAQAAALDGLRVLATR